ncbi:MAG: hypothetical protein ACTSWE_02615 [Promethearchaeota archaeon]
MLIKKDYQIVLMENPKKFLQYIFLGTSIPILPEFREYILHDFKLFNANALILEEIRNEEDFGEETDNVEGIVLIYDDDGGDILYFGFFGVFDHSKDKINFLLDTLIDHAKKGGYTCIRGPINIPTVIFGWGFLTRGSKKTFHLRKNLNPPIYNDCFREKGFRVFVREKELFIPGLKVRPEHLKHLKKKEGNRWVPVDFSNFEYCNPGRDGMMEIKEEFLGLFARNLPESARITPNPSNSFDNLVKFIFHHGAEWMMWIVRYKPTGELAGGGYMIPDIFSKDKRGVTAVDLHAWVVDEKFRRHYLSVYQYAHTYVHTQNRATPHYLRLGYSWVSETNPASLNALIKQGARIVGAKEIFEYKIN